jgi:phenol hydroxylase P0 protein
MTDRAPAPPDAAMPACDLTQRYVRVLGRRENGLVEFAFSIGWPELSVDLMLPAPDFEAFCAANRVRHLDD